MGPVLLRQRWRLHDTTMRLVGNTGRFNISKKELVQGWPVPLISLRGGRVDDLQKACEGG